MKFTPEILEKLLPEVLRLVLQAGLIIKEQSRGPLQIFHKGPMDLVTQTDLAVEDFLIKELGKLDPSIAFMGEESTAKGATASLDKPAWIIDPVDGTTNYAHGVPFVATSVGLWDGQKIVLGVVNCPLLGECFYAAQGMGCWMGTWAVRDTEAPKTLGDAVSGESARSDEAAGAREFTETVKLAVSSTKKLSAALLATGFPYEASPNLKIILERLEKVLPETRGLRRCGAAAIDLAYVAAGRFDAYYEEWINPWDTAAGWLLVEEAGGRVGNLLGGEYSFSSSGIIASAPAIYPDLVKLLT